VGGSRPILGTGSGVKEAEPQPRLGGASVKMAPGRNNQKGKPTKRKRERKKRIDRFSATFPLSSIGSAVRIGSVAKFKANLTSFSPIHFQRFNKQPDASGQFHPRYLFLVDPSTFSPSSSSSSSCCCC